MIPHLVEFCFGRAQLLTQVLDLVEQGLDVLAAGLGLADGFGALVFLVLKFLDADLQFFTAGFQLAPGLDVQFISPGRERLGYRVGVGSQQLWIKHGIILGLNRVVYR